MTLTLTRSPFRVSSGRRGDAVYIICRLGLVTNCKLVLDAGEASSYTSGQSWLDLSGNGYDFFLGSTSGAAANDPFGGPLGGGGNNGGGGGEPPRGDEHRGGGRTDGRHSDLPIVFACNEPVTGRCHESYFSFEPTSTVACGVGTATRGATCATDGTFLGACRSAVQGGGGYFIQTVLFYYEGNGQTRDELRQSCAYANGEFLTN
jgi:hypothetical protein